MLSQNSLHLRFRLCLQAIGLARCQQFPGFCSRLLRNLHAGRHPGLIGFSVHQMRLPVTLVCSPSVFLPQEVAPRDIPADHGHFFL